MPDKITSVLRATLVESVYTKEVSGGRTLWTVVADGREFVTMVAQLGNKAMGLNQKICDLQISVVQKDQYTNFYLDGIQLNTETQQPSGVVQAAQQAQNAANSGTTGVSAYVSYDEYKDLTEGKEQRKQESIHRQTAAKVAAALLPQNPQEFWSNVNEIVTFFNSGHNPYYADKQAETSVTSHTADPGPGDGFQHTDDDIPF